MSRKFYIHTPCSIQVTTSSTAFTVPLGQRTIRAKLLLPKLCCPCRSSVKCASELPVDWWSWLRCINRHRKESKIALETTDLLIYPCLWRLQQSQTAASLSIGDSSVFTHMRRYLHIGLAHTRQDPSKSPSGTWNWLPQRANTGRSLGTAPVVSLILIVGSINRNCT